MVQFLGYLTQAPKLLDPNKILTQLHCNRIYEWNLESASSPWTVSTTISKPENFLHYFGEIPLANLYISATRNWKFRAWIETEQSFFKSSWNVECLSL